MCFKFYLTGEIENCNMLYSSCISPTCYLQFMHEIEKIVCSSARNPSKTVYIVTFGRNFCVEVFYGTRDNENYIMVCALRR